MLPGRARPGLRVLWLSQALWLAPTAAVAAPSAPADASLRECAATLGPGARVMKAPSVAMAWLPDPQPLPLGRHFALRLRLCSPQPWAVTRVDADMPAHRHGMNYRASLRGLSSAEWRAEGLMFHMAGRWRLMIDVVHEGRQVRLEDELELR